MKTTRQKWIDAAIVLGRDPTAVVRCPVCDDATLGVRDVFPAAESAVFERYLTCPACNAVSVLRMRRDDTAPQARERFVELVRRAARSSHEHAALLEVLRELIDFIRSAPEHRATFVECFRSIIGVDGGVPLDAPTELLPYCMRILRWPEVEEAIRTALNARIADGDSAAIEVLSRYAEAFDSEPAQRSEPQT